MSAPSWKGLLEEFVVGEQNSAVNELAKGLQSRNVKLLEIVEGLGSYLTSTEKHVRCKGTQLLSELLHRLPFDYLDSKEVDVLIEFYRNRLKDHFTVAPHVLYGLVALSGQPLLRDECVVDIVRDIFSDIHTQSLQQAARWNVYTILDTFLTKRLEALLPMGGDFVIGFIQTMDSEKDPRCLILAFRSVRIIALNFPIDVFAEELFEVVACYFPIDFTPPPNDPHRVSRDDLILGLRGCLSATSKFAEFCLPLLLEKLTSSIPSAKLDALQTLATCAEVYGAEKLQEFLISFWSEIRREVFAPHNEALEGASLAALTALVAALSNHMTEAEKTSCLDSFINDIYKDCSRHLLEPELRLLYPSARLLQAAAGASDPACTKVCHKVIPVLLEQIEKHVQVSQRRNLLDLIISFCRITTKVIQSKEATNPLITHKEALMPVVSSLMADPSPQLRMLAVRAAGTLLQVPSFMTDTQRYLVATHVTNLILKDPDLSVREEAVLAAVSLAKEDMDIVKDKVLSQLLIWIKEEKMESNTLETSTESVTSPEPMLDDSQAGGDGPSVPAVAVVAGAGPEHDRTEFVYKALSRVTCEPELVKTTAPQLLTRIAYLDTQPGSAAVLRESQYTCGCLQQVTENGVRHPSSLEFLKSHLLPRVFVLTISGALSECTDATTNATTNATSGVVTRPEVVETLAACIRSIVSNLTHCNDLVATIVRTFMVGDLSSFSDVINNNSIGFQPLKISSPWQQTQLLSLLSAVVSSVPREVSVPQLDLLLSRLQEVACGTSHQYSATTAAKCFAALLNKLPTDDAVTSVTEGVCQSLLDMIDCLSLADHVRLQALSLWAWMTKALVLRGHPAQNNCVNKLLEWLEVPVIAEKAAEGFSVVLTEYQDTLTPMLHAQVRLMYKQRFFLHTAPRLVAGFKASSEGHRVYYLTALSHLLRHLPKQVLTTELPPLLPLLIQSLACEQVNLQLSTVSTLAELLSDQPELLSKHVDEILPNILKLTLYKPSMKVRMEALRCLGLMTSLPVEILVPHQSHVVRHLGKSVGDHKRIVRREAVQARALWYLLETNNK